MKKVTLYDAYERPIDLSALKQEQATVNTTGVRQPVMEHPSVGLTPGRLAALLRESETGDPTRYLALAEEMEEKDLHYLGVIGTRKRQVSQLEITIEPASEDPDDIANAELVRPFIERSELQAELFDILDAIGKGFSVTEIVWDMSGKEWMPIRLDRVDPGWIRFDTDDRRTPRLLSDNGGTEELAPFKFITMFSTAKSGLPLRGGLARAAAWSYLFKNFNVKSWVQFSEVYGQPIRVGKFHSGASEDDKRTLLRAVSQIGRDAAAIIPQSMQIDFIEAKASGSMNLFKELADFLDQQVSKAVLGQTATTDAIAGGHAVGQEHNDVRGDIERADCNQLEAILRRDLVQPIIDLNRGPQKAYPKLHIGRAEETDLAEFSSAVDKMARLGLPVSKTQIYGKMGLIEPEDKDDILVVRPTAPKENPGEREKPENQPAEDPEEEEEKPASQTSLQAALGDRDAIDDMVDLMMDDWDQLMAPIVGPALQVFAESDSLEDAKDQLVAALQQADPSKFQDLLARAQFNMRIAGRVGAPIAEPE